MGVVYMTVGLPTTGKTRFVYTNMKWADKSNLVILDSDELRKELFGSEVQDKNEELFKEMNRRTKQALKDGKDVYYCATNINRKRRIDFIKNICKGYKVICILFYLPFGEIIENNMARKERKIPYDVLERMYKYFEIPLYEEGFFQIIVNNKNHKLEIDWQNPISDFYMNYNQDNIHHNKTIGGHIEDIIYFIEEQYNDPTMRPEILKIVALFHDLGKPYCREVKDYSNTTYYCHENISAYLYLKFIDKGLLNENDNLVLTLISHHMDFCKGKKIENIQNELGEINYKLLYAFNKADTFRRGTILDDK